MRNTFQKSIYAKYDLASGTSLNLQNISFKKPDLGISASMYKNNWKKLNKKLKKIKNYLSKTYFDEKNTIFIGSRQITAV